MKFLNSFFFLWNTDGRKLPHSKTCIFMFGTVFCFCLAFGLQAITVSSRDQLPNTFHYLWYSKMEPLGHLQREQDMNTWCPFWGLSSLISSSDFQDGSGPASNVFIAFPLFQLSCFLLLFPPSLLASVRDASHYLYSCHFLTVGILDFSEFVYSPESRITHVDLTLPVVIQRTTCPFHGIWQQYYIVALKHMNLPPPSSIPSNPTI